MIIPINQMVITQNTTLITSVYYLPEGLKSVNIIDQIDVLDTLVDRIELANNLYER
jgi:hypothetical protein